MNSQTSKIAQNIRLQEWAHMIQECKSRPTGMTIDAWCAQHNITKCDYYYRMRAVWKACIETVPTEVVQQAIVPVSMELLNPVDDHPVPSDAAETIELTFHGVNIKVTHQTSDELLKRFLGCLPMLNDATCFNRIYIVCGYTDLRSGIDTLVSIVDARTDNSPCVPDTLYLFCGRKSDRIKGLVWEKDGFLLLYKRLEKGKFLWPRNEEEVRNLTPSTIPLVNGRINN